MDPHHLLKALHNNRYKCDWVVVIQAAEGGFLWWNNYGGLQAGLVSGLTQRLVRDLDEDSSQLKSTIP